MKDSFCLRIRVVCLLVVLWSPSGALAQLRAEHILSAGGTPVAFVADPAVPNVFYVVFQEGVVDVVVDGVTRPDRFIDLRGAISSGGERGLLGMAFPPSAATSGYVFFNFTDTNGDTVVARFNRTIGDPYSMAAVVDTRLDFRWSTGERVIRQPFANHNGGHLAFGPDGYLYIGLGDGGSGNDPQNNAQSPGTLLGKMLRVDVNVNADDPNGFRIPEDNPFLDGVPISALPEIWSFGWRNPWRYSFDDFGEGATGALIVGDVGQNAREEINYEPHRAGGRNYGWRMREGRIDTPGVQRTIAAYLPLADPIHDYPRPDGFAVTGGYVYRGSRLPAFYRGRYFFADYVTSRVWSMALTVDPATGEAVLADLIEHTDELGGPGRLGQVTSFGRDLEGELYLTTSSGQVLRIAPSLDAPDPPRELRARVTTRNVSPHEESTRSVTPSVSTQRSTQTRSPLRQPPSVVAPLPRMIATALPAAAALPHDIPDFSTDPSRSTVRSVRSGSWASPSTWSSGQVPTANHIVHVDPGHVVTIDTTGALAYTLAVHGTLRFSPTVNTSLKATNLMVMGDHGMPGMTGVGYLEVGTADAPIAANVTAEIIIADSPLGSGVADPEQFGTGLLNFGRMTMHGSATNPTFVRMATEPRAGDTTLTLSQPVSGWQVGHRLVLPDTRHLDWDDTTNGGWENLQNEWEERTVQSISDDGLTVTLTTALQFDHLGARDLNGVLDFLPHVGNLTRNVVVRSENASGTRGHTISVHIADTDVRYVLFKDLGRTKFTPLNTTTNAIGRYPIHMHHNRGPLPSPANGYQFTLIGNAVDGGSVQTQFKWGIAVHNSHYGLIQDNVVYNYNGASIATEDGSESFNVFDHNFAIRGMGEGNNAVSEARQAMGTEGVGFWFRGPSNYVRNNVAANFQNPVPEAAYGFVFQFIFLGDIAIPTFKGADPAIPGEFITTNGNNTPLLQFENNEAYGAMQGGLTYWWVGSRDPSAYVDAQESVIKDFKVWHTYNKTIYVYPGAKVTFDGLKIRGQHTANSHCCGNGIYFGDYSTTAHIVRNADIQGVEKGIDAPSAGYGPAPNVIVENSYLRNWYNINVPTPSSVNGCWMENKLVTIVNTRFEAPPGRSLVAISMKDRVNGAECLTKLDEVRVYAYNGDANDNFQVYHSRSDVLPRPPGSCTQTTRPGISDPTCPIAPLGSSLPIATRRR